MLRFMGRSVGLTFLSLGIALAFAVALVLILIQLLGGRDFIDDVSCRLGLSTDCIREELAAERERLEGMRARLQELEALYGRLAGLEHASESFVVFYEDHTGPFKVVSGHRYESLTEPGTFVSAWCYINASRRRTLNVNLHIAEMDDDGELTAELIDDEALSISGVTQAEVAAARHRCRWPVRPS